MNRYFRHVLFTGFLLLVARTAAASTTCTLVVDAATGATLLRNGTRCGERLTPASTFKIALSLVGFDSGILRSANEPAWPYQERYQAWNDAWKRTTTPKSWLRDSVVWYSQVLTRTLGAERLQDYVDRLDYGNRDLRGDPGLHNGLTNAWLSSSLAISAEEQAAFVRRLLRREVPVSRSAIDRTAAIMPSVVIEGWRLRGKPGTGFRHLASGANDPDRQIGWFVGWAQRARESVVFVRLIEDEQPERINAGLRARDALHAAWPAIVANLPPASSSR